MDIIVIGCGVSGLSTALRLQAAGHTVQIWARALPPHTTSNVAAAVWYPYKAFPEDLVLGWAAASYQAFDALMCEPDAGVVLAEGIELFPVAVADPWWKSAVPSFRRAHADELPATARAGYVFAAHVIEMDVYLPYLQRRFLDAGGVIAHHELHTLDAALEVTDSVVDCAGLGARELAGDATLTPIRGQVLRVAQVGVERFTFDDHGPGGVTYIVPRRHDIILGGTAQEGDANLTPDAATAQAILERCAALEPRLRAAMVLEHRVGLRPGRPAVRLERENTLLRKTIIHNYGHGGAGVTLSWGCADAVVRLLQSATP